MPVYNFQTDTGNYFADGVLVHNCDLHARHLWLVGQREALTERLMADPDWYDAGAAGWWVWGASAWIGSGWCSGDGPWQVADGVLVRGNAGRGVHRQLPHLGDAGRGVHSGSGSDLLATMQALQARLRRVRVACGDWSRVCGPSVLSSGGYPVGVFLDPPYADTAGRAADIYAVDSASVAHAVREWAIETGRDLRIRVVLAGYEGEHDMPGDWRVVAWKASGGYGSQGNGAGRANSTRERLWLSPGCVAARQGVLL